MKILFYNHTGQVSGAERLLLMILEGLDTEQFEILLACPTNGDLEAIARKHKLAVTTLAALEARFTWKVSDFLHYCMSFLGVIRSFRRTITCSKPDLIHANSIRAGLVASAASVGSKIPVVWHLHDMLPHHPLSTAIRFYASVLRRARMIAVSEAVRRNFCGSFSSLLKTRVVVIPNAIDLTRFRQDDDRSARESIRAELQLNDGDFAVGIVGQITPRKGQLELLRAFAEARRFLPNAVLLIVGAPLFNRDDQYLETLRHVICELGIDQSVRLLGARKDVPAVMQALDLLVVNSAVEPFGLVILEAMACGTPVLAAAVDGIPEIIELGRNGWLVPPRDTRMLAEAIEYLACRPDLRAQLRREGRLHVTDHFSAVRYIASLEDFYQHTLEPAVKPARKQRRKLPQPSGAVGEIAPGPAHFSLSFSDGRSDGAARTAD